MLAELVGTGVRLTLATKTVPQEMLRKVADRYPDLCFGANRQQELASKWFAPSGRWRFIGRLQRNKVKYLVGQVCMIESVDSLELAREIDRQAAKHDLVMPILVEVNLGEEQKGGVPYDEAASLVETIGCLPNVRLDGLMVVLPKDGAEEAAAKTKRIYDELKAKYPLHVLSMGMSGDYEIALRYGSTELRLGSKIFGQRS